MDRSIVFSVHDLKLYPITDPGDASTDPTYGTPVDVPGVSEVTLEPSISEEMLRGDGRIIDSRSVLDSLSLSFTYGKLDPTVLAVLDGGTVTANAGTTTTRYVRNGTDLIPSFGFAALVSEVDNPGGAAKIYGYNAKINGGSLFGASDNSYNEPSFDAQVIPLTVDPNPLFATDLEDVGTVLPADSAALIATYAALV